MKQLLQDESVLRRYLLGELAPVEQLEVEEQLFLSKDYLLQLRSAEDELIDDYVTGELSASDKERFQKHFLSEPERYESLRVAVALQKYINRNAGAVSTVAESEPLPAAQPKASFFSFLRLNNPLYSLSLVAAALLITLGGLWIVIKILRKPSPPSPIQAQLPAHPEKDAKEPESNVPGEMDANRNAVEHREQEQQAVERGQERHSKEEVAASPKSGQNKQLRKPETPTREPSVTSSFLVLPIGTVRGEGQGGTPIEIPSNAGVVELQMPLIGNIDFPSYRASLKTAGDTTLLKRTGLKATMAGSRKIVPLAVPARLLKQQKYHIELSGINANGEIQEIGTYSFQVAK